MDTHPTVSNLNIRQLDTHRQLLITQRQMWAISQPNHYAVMLGDCNSQWSVTPGHSNSFTQWSLQNGWRNDISVYMHLNDIPVMTHYAGDNPLTHIDHILVAHPPHHAAVDNEQRRPFHMTRFGVESHPEWIIVSDHRLIYACFHLPGGRGNRNRLPRWKHNYQHTLQ